MVYASANLQLPSNDEPSPTGRSRPALPRNYKKSMFTREP